jgi:hypothetical protein
MNRVGAADPVDEWTAHNAAQGHRCDEESEDECAGRVGLVVPVDHAQRQPVVGGSFREGHAEHHDADQDELPVGPY